MASSTCNTVLRGAAAGLVATAAMSAFLLAAQNRGAIRKQPPRIIVESLLPEMTDEQARSAAVGAHFGYGLAGGVIYSIVGRLVPRSAIIGTVFGLAVWAAGYEGWLPALGILPPAHHDRRPRALTMLVAHAIYGAVLGAVD